MRATLLSILLILNLVAMNVKADAIPEYTLKAAYLYNFALLTEWPKDEKTSSPFKLCFYKEDLGGASDALKNKTIHHKKLEVVTVETSSEAQACHVLFIRASEEKNGQELIQSLANLPILIVGENSTFSGADIILGQENRKLTFDISLKNLKATTLELSSHLLKLAQKVEYP